RSMIKVWRNVMIGAASTTAVVLGGLVSWQTLGWDRPALMSDLMPITDRVAKFEDFGTDTRVLVLNGDWWRYEARLSDVREQIEAKPQAPYLKELERRLRREQNAIQHQIDELRK
ncbi:MAG: hypothetical protein ACR2Q4_06470, partial [Geminicoccaceae bacterium]